LTTRQAYLTTFGELILIYNNTQSPYLEGTLFTAPVLRGPTKWKVFQLIRFSEVLNDSAMWKSLKI